MSRRHRCIYPDRKRCMICGKLKLAKRSERSDSGARQLIDLRVLWLRIVFPIVSAAVFILVVALPFGGTGARIAVWYRRWMESL